MPYPQSLLLFLGVVLIAAGVSMALLMGSGPGGTGVPLVQLGLFLGLAGVGLVVAGLCAAMKNLQAAVPGHFLLHPRTGTRFSPHQALAIQRRLDRIRREMSTDSVAGGHAEPVEPSLPSTPPPWDLEPPPSYDTVMKSQEHAAQQIRPVTPDPVPPQSPPPPLSPSGR